MSNKKSSIPLDLVRMAQKAHRSVVRLRPHYVLQFGLPDPSFYCDRRRVIVEYPSPRERISVPAFRCGKCGWKSGAK